MVLHRALPIPVIKRPLITAKFLLITALLLSWSCPALSNDVVAEGRATIENGDVIGARGLATRRAIAHAIESQGAVVSGQTLISPGVALESAQMRATGCATQTTPISEIMRNNEVVVSVSVSVTNNDTCMPVCRRATLNKIAITLFAIEFPEPSLTGENDAVPALTAVEIARFINQRRHLPAVFDSRFSLYSSPTRAPQQHGGNTASAHFAQKHSAQYVLGGVYRDFSISNGVRRIEIEAFLHDGANGAVLARQTFSRNADGDIRLRNNAPIGSPQFYASDLGRAWGALYADIAAWVETTASCLPFIARVLKVQDKQLQIDAGAESGLSAGDTLSLHQWKEPPVRGEDKLALGREKFARATVRIRSVYPNFSIGELVEAPKNLRIAPGDVLYAD